MDTTAASSDNLFATLKSKSADATQPAVPTIPVPVQAPVLVIEEAPEAAPTELDMLKNRARLMGIVFSNNIGIDSLKGKIQAKLDDDDARSQPSDQQDDEDEPEVKSEPMSKVAAAQKMRDDMFTDQMKLVRLRITNLNPSKKDLPGEIITFANRILGSVRKFVPFGEATDNGYHVPYCIYQLLKDREFVNIKTRKDSRGRVHIESNMAREFALEVLDPLTTVELARLSAAQSAAAGQD